MYVCAERVRNSCHWNSTSALSSQTSGSERDPFYADQKYYVMLAANSSLGYKQMPRSELIETQFLGIK